MKTLLIFLSLLLVNNLFSQTERNTSIDKTSGFYVYKTETDFFNNKETFLCDYKSYDLTFGKVDYIDKNNKKVEITLNDSSYFGFKDPIIRGDGPQVKYIHSYDIYYKPYCGGTKDYYVTSSLKGYGTVDEDGFVTSYTTYGNNTDYSYNYIEFWFIDKKRNLGSKNIEDFLVFVPELKAKFEAEKKGTDKKVFKRNKHFIYVKYFKLYMQNQMQKK